MYNSFYENLYPHEAKDLLRAYDCYIATAADAGLLTSGWVPVCVEEFYDHEYQNVWDPAKGAESFDYMFGGDDPELESPVYELISFNGARISLEAGQLMAQFPDENEKRILRSRIQDIRNGDAFLIGSGIHYADGDAHQNMDEPDCPWIVYDAGGDGWFEEDIQNAAHYYADKLNDSVFIFNNDLYIRNKYNPGNEIVEGSLKATDGLIARLLEAAQTSRSESELTSLTGINFTVAYDPKRGTIVANGAFSYSPDAAETGWATLRLCLSERETAVLRQLMEGYCSELYQTTCLAFVTESRSSAARGEVVSSMSSELNAMLLDGEFASFSDICVEIPLDKIGKPDHMLVVWGEENDSDDKFYSLSVYKVDEKGEPTIPVDGMQAFSDSESFDDLTAAAWELLERVEKTPAVEKAPETQSLHALISGAESRRDNPDKPSEKQLGREEQEH